MVVLPNCSLVSTLISPLNYFTGYTYVIGIYTLVESTPGKAKRSHLFTLVFHCNQPSLSSFCLKLVLFTYLHFLLLSSVYTRKEKGHNEIIIFKLPHPIQCSKWLKKKPFSGTQLYLFFTTCSSSNTVSLRFIFHLPGCSGKLCPFQSQPEWCLASLGGCKHGYRWWGSQKITEPPKVMSEAPGSSLERDWIIWNPAPLPQLLPFPLLLLTDGGPRTSTLPPGIKNKL